MSCLGEFSPLQMLQLVVQCPGRLEVDIQLSLLSVAQFLQLLKASKSRLLLILQGDLDCFSGAYSPDSATSVEMKTTVRCGKMKPCDRSLDVCVRVRVRIAAVVQASARGRSFSVFPSNVISPGIQPSGVLGFFYFISMDLRAVQTNSTGRCVLPNSFTWTSPGDRNEQWTWKRRGRVSRRRARLCFNVAQRMDKFHVWTGGRKDKIP